MNRQSISLPPFITRLSLVTARVSMNLTLKFPLFLTRIGCVVSFPTPETVFRCGGLLGVLRCGWSQDFILGGSSSNAIAVLLGVL